VLRRIAKFFVGALLSFSFSPVQAAEWNVVEADLSEWSDPGKWWRTENGVFIAESKGGKTLPKIHYLEWKGSTGKDFELSLEYRITAKSPQDAGVNFRVERPHAKNLPNLPSYQAELDTCNLYSKQRFIRDGKLFGHIHDGKRSHMFKRNLISSGHPGGRISTKPLPKKFVPAQAFRKPPEWNHCRVVAVGGHIQLFLNGVLANEIHDRDPKNRSTGEGIALQYRPNGGYRFEVRDLKFRPMAASSTAGRLSGGELSVERAHALATAGKHAAAAEMLEEVFTADPSAMSTMGGLGLATLYAALGEREKHHAFCERFFAKYAKRKWGEHAERPAKAYLLFPGADDPALLRKADEATRWSLKKGGHMRIWFELTRGMAQYRTGDLTGAMKSFRQPLNGKHAGQRILARAYGAMVAFKQGNSAQASKLLAEAERESEKAARSKQNWNDVITAKIAIGEARKLIR